MMGIGHYVGRGGGKPWVCVEVAVRSDKGEFTIPDEADIDTFAVTIIKSPGELLYRCAVSCNLEAKSVSFHSWRGDGEPINITYRMVYRKK